MGTQVRSFHFFRCRYIVVAKHLWSRAVSLGLSDVGRPFVVSACRRRWVHSVADKSTLKDPAQCSLANDDAIGPLRKYSDLLQKGILKPDQKQFWAVNKIQELYNRLKNYEPTSTTFHPQLLFGDKNSVDSTLNRGEVTAVDRKAVPKGLYIHGGVGSGKTLLMDLFYDCLPTSKKKRVHFNAFMLYLYSEIHRWNLCCDADDELSDFLTPTETIARKILQDAWIVCFDEIQLSDYGTSSLLSAIFTHLIDHGAVIIATSNRAPDDLGSSSLTQMHDGEVGETVIETIASFKRLLKEQCEVFQLDSDIDYRNYMKQGQKTYLYPQTPENDEKFDEAFVSRIEPGEKLRSTYLNVYGRDILVPISTRNGLARFTFKELCCTPKGPADYIQICNHFQTVFIDGIPQLNIHRKNEARRLLSFIDAAYESRTKLFCTAAAAPEDIFTMLPKEDADSSDADVTDTMHLEMIGEIAYDLQLHGLDFRTLGFISGEDEIFSFKRAISRLKEMQGILYQMASHRPQDFSPYTGSNVEREDAEKNRWVREMRRRQKIKELEDEQEGENESKKANGTESDNTGLSTETDWGDEASYVAWSKDITRKQEEDRKRREINKRQADAPKFGEQHFWGFGWWENAVQKVKKKVFLKDDSEK